MVQQTVSATNLPIETTVIEDSPKNELSENHKTPSSEKKFYQKWWFWVIVVVAILGLVAFIYSY